MPRARTEALPSARRGAARARPLTLALAGILIVVPWPFGSVVAWAWAGLALATALLLGLSVIAAPAPDRQGSPALRLATLCYAGVILWAAFQASPLAPASWHHPAWAASGLPEAEGSISVDRERTRAAILRLLAYGGIFALAFRVSAERSEAYALIRAAALAALPVAVYALVLQQAGIEQVLWLEKRQHEGVATGPFINRNNLATYLNLALLCWLVLLTRGRARREIGLPWRARLVALVEASDLRPVWGLVAAAVVLTASLATASRGGLLSLALTGLVGLLLATLQRRREPMMVVVLLAAGVLAGLYITDAGSRALERLAGLEGDARFSAWAATLQAIADRPWLGTGLGTYEPAFRPYRPPEVPTAFDHAHNDFLELALELGLPAAILLALALLIPTALCLAGLFRTGYRPTAPMVGVLATVLVLAHSLVDFGLHIPAIAATYAALLGIGTGRALAPLRPAPP